MSRAASAPASLACFVSLMASAVEFEPVPAMTGTLFPHLFHADVDDPLVLLVGERGRLAGGAAGHDARDAAFYLEVDEVPEGLLIDLSVLERSYYRNDCA